MSYYITSPKTPAYNCIAWAAEYDNNWWWPDPMKCAFWPEDLPREETLENFVSAYNLIGYDEEADESFEHCVKKVAIYVDSFGKPTHASRQVDSAFWTSKLGKSFDIKHPFISEWGYIILDNRKINLSIYGKLGIILKKYIL